LNDNGRAEKEVILRRLVAPELVSVDGVMEKPEEWAFPCSNEEVEEENAAGMAASDAVLPGRVTYEGPTYPHMRRR
jgi:hypothetical protein